MWYETKQRNFYGFYRLRWYGFESRLQLFLFILKFMCESGWCKRFYWITLNAMVRWESSISCQSFYNIDEGNFLFLDMINQGVVWSTKLLWRHFGTNLIYIYSFSCPIFNLHVFYLMVGVTILWIDRFDNWIFLTASMTSFRHCTQRTLR